MSRNYLRTLAVGATVAAASTAFGADGDILAVHPVFNNREAIGTGGAAGNALVQFFMGNAPTATAIANGVFAVQLYAADGTTLLGGSQNVAAADCTEIVDAATGGTVENGDIWQIDLSTYLAVFGTAAFVDIIYVPDTDSLLNDADATTTSVNDQRYFINRNAPTLSQALVEVDTMTPANSKLFLVYNIPAVGPAGGTQENIGLAQADGAVVGAEDNPDDTEAGPLSNADFQISTDGGANFANLDATGISMFAVADDSIFIEITFDSSMNSEIDDNVGNANVFVRTASTADVFDSSGNRPQTNAVNLEDKPDLAVTAAEWRLVVPNGGGAVASSLAVSFNLPIDSGNLGDATFYNNLTLNDADGMTDVVVAAVVGLDPMDNNTVLLTASAPGADGVAADGLSEASNGSAGTGTFSIDLDAGTGTPPQDTFGVAFPAASNTTEAIGDGIAPTLLYISFHDLNGDGEQDAVAAVYNEPMANTSSTSGLTLAGVASAVNPFSQIDPNTFALVADNVVNTTAFASGDLTVSRTSVDVFNDGTVDPRETNNAIVVAYDPQAYDWDNDGMDAAGGDTTEAIPGTGDDGSLSLAYDANVGGMHITDAGSNAAATFGATGTVVDRAVPVVFCGLFFTGDNQLGGSNSQFFTERDAFAVANVGDQTANNRLAVFVSEPFQNVPTAGNTTEQSIFFGPDSTTFNNNDLLFGTTNSFTLGFVATPADSDLAVGNDFSVITGSGLRDVTTGADVQGNELLVSNSTIKNGVALYTPLTVAVDGTTVNHAAALIDTDNDNFANEIRIGMTQPVDGSTVDVTDFTVTGFTNLITAAGIDGSNPSVIVLTLDDGRASMSSTLTVTYNGASDATLINSNTALGGSGIAVANSNVSFTATAIVQPSADTQNVAIMPLVGTIEVGGSPAPRGTKIFAMTAVPTASRIIATHNNVEFSVTDSFSRESFTDWLFGLREFVYLLRYNDNFQEYSNDKFGVDNETFEDTISLRINANNLANITFTGNGESSSDRITNGRVSLCWDVLRSSDGTAATFFRNGYEINDNPIVSAAVITSDDGSYSMHVSAPIAAFNGRSRLDSIGKPIIMVVELPSGERFACSSLLTSADVTNLAGGPLLFRANNRTQGTGPTAGDALDAARFDVDLNNVGMQAIFPGWNLEGFPRRGGWATNTGSRPVLPSGITNNDVVVGTGLTAVGALDQFVFFNDSNGDGEWTIGDDGGNLLSSIIIDADCFAHFWFTMTSFGVQLNTSVTNLVGGYGLGFFNNTTSTYGAFQFGPALSSATIFANGAFPNNSATQGWFLGTVSNNFNPATGFFTSNADADYLITFENSGSNNIEVTSRSDTPGNNNPNDTESLSSGQAIFVHREN